MIRTGPCERGIINATPASAAEGPIKNRAWILAASVLGSSMVCIDGAAISVGLPMIQTELGVDVSALLWVVNAYSLGLAALMLIGGAAGDYFGRRRILVIGVVVFTLASIACGLAENPAQLITARAVQGIGGALLVPSNLAIIGAVFNQAERGKAIGTWAASTALICALGPLLGGWLIDRISWRAVFFLNAPLALIVLLIAWRFMPETSSPVTRRHWDWLGAVLVAAALGLLAFGLTKAGELGWIHPLVTGALFGAVLLLLAFVATERRSAHPMIPLALFRSRNFSGANLMTFLFYMALAGLYFLLPFNLIHVQHFSAATTGAVFLPVTTLVAGLSRWSGAMQERIGARWPLVGGPLLTAVGFALLAWTAAPGAGWTDFVLPMITVGLGVAIHVSPLSMTVMNAAPAAQSGIASGINNSVEEVSSLLAVAIFGSITLSLFQHSLPDHLLLAGIELPHVERVVEEMGSHMTSRGMPDIVQGADLGRLRSAVSAAFLESYRAMMLVAAGLAVLSSVVAALMIERTTRLHARRNSTPGTSSHAAR